MGWNLCFLNLGLGIFITQWFWSLEGFYFHSIPQLLVSVTWISIATLSFAQNSGLTMVSHMLGGEYASSFYFISVTMRHFQPIST